MKFLHTEHEGGEAMNNEMLDQILDDAPVEWDDLHVFPVDDLLPHTTDGTDCRCDPVIEVHGGKLIIIHNAYDGRE